VDDSDRDIPCYGQALVRASGGPRHVGERVEEETFLPRVSIPECSGHAPVLCWGHDILRMRSAMTSLPDTVGLPADRRASCIRFPEPRFPDRSVFALLTKLKGCHVELIEGSHTHFQQ